MDDIVFGASSPEMVKLFFKLMSLEFEISLVRELSYFHYLQIKKIK